MLINGALSNGILQSVVPDELRGRVMATYVFVYVGFTPIGPNKPLTVEIRHVYTGKFPERAMFGHRGDMAVVSGVKNYSAFDATARAVNFLETGVAPGFSAAGLRPSRAGRATTFAGVLLPAWKSSSSCPC